MLRVSINRDIRVSINRDIRAGCVRACETQREELQTLIVGAR